MDLTPNTPSIDLNWLSGAVKDMSQKTTVSLVERADMIQILNRLSTDDASIHHQKAVQLAMHLFPKDQEVIKSAIRLLIAQSDPASALEHIYMKQSEFLAKDVEFKLLEAEALELSGAYDLAAQVVNSLDLPSSNVMKADVYYRLAHIEQSKGNFSEAFVLLKHVLTFSQGHTGAVQEIGTVAEKAGLQKESLIFHKKLTQHQPYNAQAWYNLGQAYFYTCHYEDAITSLEYAHAIEPDMLKASKSIAEICILIGKHKKALRYFYDVLEHTPPEPELLKQVGTCYLTMENVVKARQYFILSRNLDPLDDEVFHLLSKCYLLENKPEIALKYIERAITLSDTNEEYIGTLASIQDALGDREGALMTLRSATELAPEVTESWIQLAEYVRGGQGIEAALEILEEAEEYTCGPDLDVMRSTYYFMEQNQEEGIEYLAKAMEEDNSIHRTLFKFCPELKNNREVQGVLKYFEAV